MIQALDPGPVLNTDQVFADKGAPLQETHQSIAGKLVRKHHRVVS